MAANSIEDRVDPVATWAAYPISNGDYLERFIILFQDSSVFSVSTVYFVRQYGHLSMVRILWCRYRQNRLHYAHVLSSCSMNWLSCFLSIVPIITEYMAYVLQVPVISAPNFIRAVLKSKYAHKRSYFYEITVAGVLWLKAEQSSGPSGVARCFRISLTVFLWKIEVRLCPSMIL